MLKKSDSSNQTQLEEANAEKYLTFELAKEVYAVNILRVKEIMELEDITAMPMVPEFVSGAINLRGKAVPVIDLAARLGFGEVENTRRTCIIVVEMHYDSGDVNVGIMVDAVSRVIDIHKTDIEEAPSLGNNLNTDYIEGLGKIQDRFVVLLEINKVLSLEDIKAMSEAFFEGEDSAEIPLALAGENESDESGQKAQHS